MIIYLAGVAPADIKEVRKMKKYRHVLISYACYSKDTFEELKSRRLKQNEKK